MQEFLSVITQQFQYTRRVLTERAESESPEHLLRSLIEPVLPGEATALEVYSHGCDTFYWVTRHLIDPDIAEDMCTLPIRVTDAKGTIDQMISAFLTMVDDLKIIAQKTGAEDLDKEVPTIFEGKLMPLIDWLGISVFHTVGHVAQALRLQAINLRKYVRETE